MIYLLLISIVGLLIYIAFFTPERREQREVRRIQRQFNTPLYPNAVEFVENDDRNTSHPDEIVKIKFAYATRKQAMDKLDELRKKYPEMGEEFAQAMLLPAIMSNPDEE